MKSPLLPRFGAFIEPATGEITRTFYQYLNDIGKQAEPVADLPAGTPTNDDLKAKLNELLASLRAAGRLKG